MRKFSCGICGADVYFENTSCTRCGGTLGYLPEAETVTSLTPNGFSWEPVGRPERLYRFCANAEHEACNWLVPADADERFCAACRHNRMVPDLGDGGNLQRWRRMEIAKRQLFYTLLKLRVPLPTREEHPEGLAFEFLADAPGAAPVMTGHDSGLIVINLAEADDAERERRRLSMGEPYRTLVGHFRHEIGHYVWDRLVRDDPDALARCREVFGDERADYGEALTRHYEAGPPPDWAERHISTYATAHPWEDFAETWAHYLHIVDTLETAHAFGLTDAAAADLTDPTRVTSAHALVAAFVPLAVSINGVNRAMGLPDLYPFVLGPAVIEKLEYIRELVAKPQSAAAAEAAMAG
jgi:hypothetical protein